MGLNRGVQFVGHSMITDPWGTIVASAGDLETIVWAEIDLESVRSSRERFPALADRKPWLRATLA